MPTGADLDTGRLASIAGAARAAYPDYDFKVDNITFKYFGRGES